MCTNESTVFDSAIRTVQPHYGFYSVLVCLIYYTYECLRMFISYFYCELHYTYIKDSNCVQSSRISPEALTKTSFYLCIILRLWHTPTVFCTYIIQGFFCTYNNITLCINEFTVFLFIFPLKSSRQMRNFHSRTNEKFSFENKYF